MASSNKLDPRSWPGLAIFLIAGLVLGLTAGLLAARDNNPGENSAEAGFARDMAMHHAQAVAMGMIAYQHGFDGEIRVVGGDIALTQQGQIGRMNQWLEQWGLGQNSTQAAMSWMPAGMGTLENGLMPGMATQAEMDALEKATGTEVDRLFLEMMIKHHLGGVHMVDGVLKLSDDPDVVALASTMKANQQAEITYMQELQKKLPRKTG